MGWYGNVEGAEAKVQGDASLLGLGILDNRETGYLLVKSRDAPDIRPAGYPAG
jgi:hypothetical protein